jgi:hypothetical protein
VSHVRGEFEAFMEPLRFVVFPRIPLKFEVEKMKWVSTDGQGWTSLDPPLHLAPGVELPPDVSFRIRVDTEGVEGWEDLEFSPGESFLISRDNPEIRFRVRYRDPDAHRLTGGRFKGRIRISVDEAQRKTIEGSGSCEIPVEGRISAWGVRRLHDRYSWLVYAGALALVLLLLAIEWALRPRFPRDLVFSYTDVIGGKERTWSLEVGARMKPVVPFLRQRIVVGRGGDAGLYREDVLCVLVPRRTAVEIRPAEASVYDVEEGPSKAQRRPFRAALDHHYRVGGDEGRLEFWLERRGKEA